jgi:hypothetical protein
MNDLLKNNFFYEEDSTKNNLTIVRDISAFLKIEDDSND